MAFRTYDRLEEDGVYCISPAFHGRSYYGCSRLNLRGRRLNHSNSAPNPLRLNILPTSPTGSIFCANFRLSPPVFSIFYEQGAGGRGVSQNLSSNDFVGWPRTASNPIQPKTNSRLDAEIPTRSNLSLGLDDYTNKDEHSACCYCRRYWANCFSCAGIRWGVWPEQSILCAQHAAVPGATFRQNQGRRLPARDGSWHGGGAQGN